MGSSLLVTSDERQLVSMRTAPPPRTSSLHVCCRGGDIEGVAIIFDCATCHGDRIGAGRRVLLGRVAVHRARLSVELYCAPSFLSQRRLHDTCATPSIFAIEIYPKTSQNGEY